MALYYFCSVIRDKEIRQHLRSQISRIDIIEIDSRGDVNK